LTTSPSFFDHRLPLTFFAPDILRVFRWRAGDWIAAGIKQAFVHVFGGHDFAQFLVQPLDNRLRRAGRRTQSVILDDLEARKAGQLLGAEIIQRRCRWRADREPDGNRQTLGATG
jgi:hypothetical protein